MPRHPATIAAEARELLDKANTAFVPANLTRGLELNVEFMEAIAELVPPPEPSELPPIAPPSNF